jgi:release factor glutamine methyltransferase
MESLKARPASSPPSGSDPDWTVGRLLRWVAEDFGARGVESPRLEAELLLAHVLSTDRIQLILDRDRIPQPEQLASFRSLVQRRRRHEPVAYLLGRREFFGYSFQVDRRVLVPRPDTESLVEVALRRTCERCLYGRMLDLCTGSGNVALAFARQRPTWRVDAADTSSGAIAVSRDNATRLGALHCVRIFESDLFAAPQAGQLSYHLITANPPYIRSADIATLPSDVRDHEPREALDGGPDGLGLIRRIVAEAPAHLAPRGVLAIEIGCDQSEPVAELMSTAGFEAVLVDRDLAARPRVVSGVRP